MRHRLSQLEFLIVPTSSRSLALALVLRAVLEGEGAEVAIHASVTAVGSVALDWCVIFVTTPVFPTKSGLEARVHVILVRPGQGRTLSSVVERIRRLA